MNPCQLYWGVWWETNHNTELISHDSFSVCFFSGSYIQDIFSAEDLNSNEKADQTNNTN